MGCAGATYAPCGATPANAVDIAADKPGKDPTHSLFDTAAKAAFMPQRLRGVIPETEYEEVIAECNRVITRRTYTESFPHPDCLCGYLAVCLTFCILLDYFISRSYHKLDGCGVAVKRWEAHGVSVRFYAGFHASRHSSGNANTIRVYIPNAP